MEMETQSNYLQSQREHWHLLQREYGPRENFKASLALFQPLHYKVVPENEFPDRDSPRAQNNRNLSTS